ncbi:hypothetical protein [uncultured Thiohalocapsa sp.]|uniref:hypothetical protein n=1 Tax=uncultured Thiohalocapsa sp. TaxID=768990 RepID=UPI0025E0A98C|nr:hypothetical protein [uncultured Thiohalocapsa sp.]
MSADVGAVLTVTNCITNPGACSSDVPAVQDGVNMLNNGGSFLQYPDAVAIGGATMSGVFAPDQSTTLSGVTSYEGFVPAPPTPAAPLRLVGQGADRNLLIADGSLLSSALIGKNVVGGLLAGTSTPGAFSILYDLDQEIIGLDVIGVESATSFVELYAYGRDGAFIGSSIFPDLATGGALLQPFIISANQPIAGISIISDDPSGVAVANLRYTPVPPTAAMFVVGLAILAFRALPARTSGRERCAGV